MDYLHSRKRRTNPKEKTNVISKIFFAYTIPLFWRSFKTELEEKDLYEVLKDYKSQELGDYLEREWEKVKSNSKNPSLFTLLWKSFGWKYFLLGLMQLFVKTALILIQPYALGKFIAYFASGQTDITREDAVTYAAMVIGISSVHCIFTHNYYLVLTGMGIKARTAFCSFIYRKVLKLSASHIGETSMGRIVTMMTKDVQIFETFVDYANDLWVGVMKGFIATYILYRRIGWATFASLGVSLLILPIQVYLGRLATVQRGKMCQKTDERLQITQEVLSAIKIIKMCTWEKYFGDKIAGARKKEVDITYRIFLLKFIGLAIGGVNVHLAFFALIITYICMGYTLTAEIFYFSLSCFRIWSQTLKVLLPSGSAQLGEFIASIRRIDQLVKVIEIQRDDNHYVYDTPRVTLKGVSVDIQSRQLLDNITLNIEKGITLITGSVGSGKSILLKTIMGNYRPTNGEVDCHGSISYASQDPWVFPSTIRQNILFGASYNEKRYNAVINVCALQYDLQILPEGDKTIVEDKGINLSKGQKARINLARAIYRNSDLYILDDCLAALDIQVAGFIFRECIINFLRDKVVIFVSNNFQNVKDAHKVVLLKDGRIKTIVNASEIPRTDYVNMYEEEKKIASVPFDIISECTPPDDMEKHQLLETNVNEERRIYDELKKTGGVNFDVYKKYIKFGGGFCAVFALFFIFVLNQSLESWQDKLLSSWTDLEGMIGNFIARNITDTREYEEMNGKRHRMFYLVIGLSLPTIGLIFLKSLSIYFFAKKASVNLHNKMSHNIINASMEFFDSNFIGNVLNRFSKDMSIVDEWIPFTYYHVFSVSLVIIGIVILIAMVNSAFLIPTVIFFAILVILRKCYLYTGRSLKRLDALTRSPVIGYLNATLEGLITIRAFNVEGILQEEFDRHQDLYTSTSYTLQTTIRAFTFYLESLCTGFITVVVSKFLFFDDGALAGDIGLALSQAFITTETLQWGIRQWAEIENQMTSVERVLEYAETKQENQQGIEVKDWPQHGDILFRNVSLTLTTSKRQILDNLSFHIKPKEKVGIVGRTGAGKSSLISTLFRLYEVDGLISIDHLDTKMLSLPFLRSKISIIPQDPVLFTGTLRENIDPTGSYSDDEIWTAVKAAQLKEFVDTLDMDIKETGGCFSVGQKQLICIARAIVRRNRIVVMDEATANMDPATDALIQESMRKNFEQCTVLIIAHKLESIMHADKIMVLDKGEIIEFDHPLKLLQNPAGAFYKMVQESGLLIDT